MDTDRIVSLVDDTLQEPEVADALAAYVVEQVVAVVDVDAWVAENVPTLLQDRVGVVLAGVRSVVEDRVSDAIRADGTRQLITGAVGAAHRAFVDLLRGDGVVDGLVVRDGEVTVNLLPLASRALVGVQQLGLLPGVDVPAFEPGGVPAEQRAELEAALGRDLPDDFGELVVYRSDRLERASASVESAQAILVAVERALWLLLVVGVVATAASVWLARRRWRAALLIAVAAAALMVVVRLLAGVAVRRVPDLVAEAGAQQAISDVLFHLQDSLTRATLLFVVVALVVVGVAWYRQPSPPAPVA
jgi:hypothetical protein